jgi:hypothetical protein
LTVLPPALDEVTLKVTLTLPGFFGLTLIFCTLPTAIVPTAFWDLAP